MMKVIVGILLIVLIAVMVILLALVSYMLWDEVCDIHQKNRKKGDCNETDMWRADRKE